MPAAYPQDVVDHALDIYKTQGPVEAERQTDIPRRTIGRWAHNAGIVPQANTQKTTQARANAAAQIAVEWSDYRSQEAAAAGAEAAHIRRALREAVNGTPIIAYDDDGDPRMVGTEVKGSNVRSLAVAYGILIDKAELLSGNATERIETWAASELDVELRALVTEFEDTIRGASSDQ